MSQLAIGTNHVTKLYTFADSGLTPCACGRDASQRVDCGPVHRNMCPDCLATYINNLRTRPDGSLRPVNPATCLGCDWFSGRPDDVCTLYDETITDPDADECSEWTPQGD